MPDQIIELLAEILSFTAPLFSYVKLETDEDGCVRVYCRGGEPQREPRVILIGEGITKYNKLKGNLKLEDLNSRQGVLEQHRSKPEPSELKIIRDDQDSIKKIELVNRDGDKSGILNPFGARHHNEFSHSKSLEWQCSFDILNVSIDKFALLAKRYRTEEEFIQIFKDGTDIVFCFGDRETFNDSDEFIFAHDAEGECDFGQKYESGQKERVLWHIESLLKILTITKIGHSRKIKLFKERAMIIEVEGELAKYKYYVTPNIYYSEETKTSAKTERPLPGTTSD